MTRPVVDLLASSAERKSGAEKYKNPVKATLDGIAENKVTMRNDRSRQTCFIDASVIFGRFWLIVPVMKLATNNADPSESTADITKINGMLM